MAVNRGATNATPIASTTTSTPAATSPRRLGRGRRNRRRRPRAGATNTRPATPSANQAEREPDRAASGTINTTVVPSSSSRSQRGRVRRQRGSMPRRMNGGTATEPNAVDSPTTRTGGRPPTPSENQPIRRETSCHRIEAASSRVGTIATSAARTGRRVIARIASGSSPANARVAAKARAASPWFWPRTLASPSATRKTRIGISRRDRGNGAPRRSATTPPARAAPPRRCSINWRRPSQSALSQPRLPKTARPPRRTHSSTGVSRACPIQIVPGKRRRSSSRLVAGGSASGRDTVDQHHGPFELGQRLNGETSDSEQVGQQAAHPALSRCCGRPFELELDAPEPADGRSVLDHADSIQAQCPDANQPVAYRALGSALPQNESFLQLPPTGELEEAVASGGGRPVPGIQAGARRSLDLRSPVQRPAQCLPRCAARPGRRGGWRSLERDQVPPRSFPMPACPAGRGQAAIAGVQIAIELEHRLWRTEQHRAELPHAGKPLQRTRARRGELELGFDETWIEPSCKRALSHRDAPPPPVRSTRRRCSLPGQRTRAGWPGPGPRPRRPTTGSRAGSRRSRRQ